MATLTVTNGNHRPSEPSPSSTPDKFSVLVPEKVSQDGLALLQKEFDVHEKKGLSADELQSIIGDYDALIVRSETKVTADLMQAGKRLKVVARAGVGVDNVDVPAATKLGIIVVNSPSGNIGAAAEHTIALMLATARNVPDASASLKAGKWERSRLTGVEMKGKMLGIIGLGKVGLTVARIALGLGMRVSAVDPYASPSIAQSANVTLVPSMNELLPISDFLTIHTPLIASTRGIISTAELSLLKRGARVLNVARGGIIDEEALLTALEEGRIAGAGLDVFTSEPPLEGSSAQKLIAHSKVVATPHLGASTVEAQENVSIDVCEQVAAILGGALPRSAVNAPLILPEEYKTLRPFVRLVEKMGALYTQHYAAPGRQQRAAKSDGQNVFEAGTTFDLIYEGQLATLTNTKPLFAALIKGLTGDVINTNVNIVNASMVAQDRGIVVNEQHSRAPSEHNYSSLVTLRARPSAPSRDASPFTTRGSSKPRSRHAAPSLDRTICGYVSGTQVFISRLDRFATSFVPDGNVLVLHNYDSPGMIGVVGSVLGKEGVNISYMSVAPVSLWDEDGDERDGGGLGKAEGSDEALMILGVNKEVSKDVLDKLRQERGILDVSALAL